MNLLLTAVYLQFFQTIASAPPVRDANYVRRPASSQNNVKFAMNSNENGNNRANSRKNNPNKLKRSNTASNSSARPNSRMTRTRSRNGKSLENKRSPSDDRKRFVQIPQCGNFGIFPSTFPLKNSVKSTHLVLNYTVHGFHEIFHKSKYLVFAHCATLCMMIADTVIRH